MQFRPYARWSLWLLHRHVNVDTPNAMMIGIGGFGRGGEFNRKYANKLMRLRIFAQFIAVLLILLFVYFAR